MTETLHATAIIRAFVERERQERLLSLLVTSDRIARAVAALRSVKSGWEQPMTTLPAGDVAALFFRDTLVVGVIWLGPNYIIARGDEGTLIRSATQEDLVRLAEAFELPKRIISVPPGGTTRSLMRVQLNSSVRHSNYPSMTSVSPEGLFLAGFTLAHATWSVSDTTARLRSTSCARASTHTREWLRYGPPGGMPRGMLPEC